MSMNFRSTFHSPMNNSSSKQLYSFAKSSRFEPTRRSQCKQSFYETKRGALDRRATGFGYGSKATFQNKEGVPFPGAYEKQSQFALNKTKRRGYSFGKDDNRSLIQNPQQVRKFPGPGSYISIDQKHKTGYGRAFENVSYSMRGKYEDPLQRHKNQLGPGHYPTYGSMTERGNYFSSKYTNSKCQIVGRQRRFQLEKIETPGPGHYNGQQKGNLNGTGTYFNSKFSTSKANAFSHSERPSPAKKNQAPDPGKYFVFSQFALRNKTIKI